MKASELPAGYVVLHGAALHVSQLRRYTSDVRRFLRLLPVTERFNGLVPCSPQWERMLADVLADDPDTTVPDLIATMRESAALYTALADEIDAA